jgi:hypothetical protein
MSAAIAAECCTDGCCPVCCDYLLEWLCGQQAPTTSLVQAGVSPENNSSRILVFGSRLNNLEHENDLDLVVLLEGTFLKENNDAFNQLLCTFEKLGRQLGKDIDLFIDPTEEDNSERAYHDNTWGWISEDEMPFTGKWFFAAAQPVTLQTLKGWGWKGASDKLCATEEGRPVPV